MAYIIEEKYSKIEFEKIYQFVMSLVIKDEDAATECETLNSSKAAYVYLMAYMGLSNMNDYNFTIEEINAVGANSLTSITEEQQKELLKNKRKLIVNDYEGYDGKTYSISKENNKYYLQLKEKYRINYAESRIAKNFHIIYYDKCILNEKEVGIFLELYYSSLLYFLSSLYNKAFEGEKHYLNFCRFFITFITIQRYINARIDFITDIDFFDEYSIRNMLASYGLDFFADMPLKYQARILKNINELLIYKGTDKVFTSIMNMFGFKNVDVFRYYLCKDYARNETGNRRTDITTLINVNEETGERILNAPEYNFYKVNVESKDLEGDLLNAYPNDFTNFVKTDPFWQIGVNELVKYNFNHVCSKYIGLETTMNIFEESLQLSYFYNTLKQIEEEYIKSGTQKSTLSFIYTEISPTDIKLFDATVALMIIVMKKIGVSRNIVDEETALNYIYGYNFQKPKDGDIFSDGSSVDEDSFNYVGSSVKTITGKDKSKSILITELLEYYQDLKNIKSYNLIGYDELLEILRNNKSYRESLQQEIYTETDYNKYRKLKAIYSVLFYKQSSVYAFTNKKTNQLYPDYETWLRNRDENLYLYINSAIPDEDAPYKILTYDNVIEELCNAIENYLNSQDFNLFFENNSLVLDFVKKYITRMILIFKAYTVDLKDLNIIYTFDNRYLNTMKFFDDSMLAARSSVADIQRFEENQTAEAYLVHEPELITKFFDKLNNIVNLIHFSTFCNHDGGTMTMDDYAYFWRHGLDFDQFNIAYMGDYYDDVQVLRGFNEESQNDYTILHNKIILNTQNKVMLPVYDNAVSFHRDKIMCGNDGDGRLYYYNGTVWDEIRPLGDTDNSWKTTCMSTTSLIDDIIVSLGATTNNKMYLCLNGTTWKSNTDYELPDGNWIISMYRGNKVSCACNDSNENGVCWAIIDEGLPFMFSPKIVYVMNTDYVSGYKDVATGIDLSYCLCSTFFMFARLLTISTFNLKTVYLPEGKIGKTISCLKRTLNQSYTTSDVDEIHITCEDDTVLSYSIINEEATLIGENLLPPFKKIYSYHFAFEGNKNYDTIVLKNDNEYWYNKSGKIISNKNVVRVFKGNRLRQYSGEDMLFNNYIGGYYMSYTNDTITIPYKFLDDSLILKTDYGWITDFESSFDGSNTVITVKLYNHSKLIDYFDSPKNGIESFIDHSIRAGYVDVYGLREDIIINEVITNEVFYNNLTMDVVTELPKLDNYNDFYICKQSHNSNDVELGDEEYWKKLNVVNSWFSFIGRNIMNQHLIGINNAVLEHTKTF